MDPSPSPVLPPNYPRQAVEQFVLQDGTRLTLRPIRSDDASRLQLGFTRLSPQSIYLRFLQSFKELSEKQARDFANVDYSTRMALVASIPGDGDEKLLGVARYSLVEQAGEGVAEAAVVVLDEYQRRGLGSLMVRRLVHYARNHGVTAFLATVHQTNIAIMTFVKRSGFAYSRKMLEPGVWEVRVDITTPLDPASPPDVN